ncbi:TPA: hypothetical protein N0F65_002604 [Lagenidium giganteum]|uniref:EGF-like domain-containing protein n=1 Tax=Lagenidium giganteum TaxID=4803 RepID=A0AAV2Z2F2_9STRA|nr:TPA: hypothetical protein N0F65_002604 [Lagenidium giganteum]
MRALLVLCVAWVAAECPNGCSGNGDCMAKDMCNCYKNFQGNDCSDRTCPFSYAHVDTPRGDLNMDQSRITNNWILTNSQQSPAGTYEYFNPSAKQHEAHFYLECSNKGICDRSTGLCTCFDGYEGNGCQRTTCPNKCSGHGTCETLRKLGWKAGGTLVGKPLPNGAVNYDLWDANTTQGCRCDPWYHGPDCSKRNCKVGVDPLYLSAGNPRYETFVIHAYITTGTITTARFRLRVFDFHGETFITKPITILDDATAANTPINVAAITAALKGVPNKTFKTVVCENQAAGPNLGGFRSKRPTGSLGLSVVCQFSDNPGKMRLPQIYDYSFDGITAANQNAMVVTSTQQGENDEWFTVQSQFVINTVSTDGLTITLTGTSPSPVTAIPGPTLIKAGVHILLAASSTATTIVLAFPLKQTLGTADKTIYLVDPLAPITVTAADAVAGAVSVGDTSFSFAAAPTLFTTGDLLFYHNQFFNAINQVYSTTNTATPPVTTYFFNINRPFGGNSLDGDTGGGADGYNEDV